MLVRHSAAARDSVKRVAADTNFVVGLSGSIHSADCNLHTLTVGPRHVQGKGEIPDTCGRWMPAASFVDRACRSEAARYAI
jgi:hypothetical protein